MTRWLVHHAQAFALAVRKLAATPWSSLFSITAMGIAFSLPAGGFVLLENANALSSRIDSAPQISLFLAPDAGKAEIAQVESRLKGHAQVRSYEFVPRDRALARIKETAGVADVVESLGRNPLPDAFIVQAKTVTPGALEALRQEMAGWPKADQVQLDSAWAQRLDAILKVGKMAVLALAALLAFALVTAIFNTIRLQILTQREEIEVAKMVGATSGFIRRPFLYYGALQGVAGGAAAWGIIAAVLWLLNGALAEVGRLYAIPIHLAHLSPEDSLSLLGFAGWLGWVGAWMSVSRHLWQIEPR